MKAVPLSDAVGAELTAFDISRPLTVEEQAELRRLFVEHQALLVRGQSVTEEAHDRFVGYLGPLQTMRTGATKEYVTNRPHELPHAGGTVELHYHSDYEFDAHPLIATSLLAQDVAPSSVPTSFANGVRAWKNLSKDLRARLEALSALHMQSVDSTRKDYGRVRLADLPSDVSPAHYRGYVHPVLLSLPHSPYKSLYVTSNFTSHIVGMPVDASETILQLLFELIYSPENVYTHHWQNNDLLVWDNMALQHRRPDTTTDPAPRVLRRVCLEGWNDASGVLEWRIAHPLTAAEPQSVIEKFAWTLPSAPEGTLKAAHAN